MLGEANTDLAEPGQNLMDKPKMGRTRTTFGRRHPETNRTNLKVVTSGLSLLERSPTLTDVDLMFIEPGPALF